MIAQLQRKLYRMYQLNMDGQKERVYKEYWNKYQTHFIERDV